MATNKQEISSDDLALVLEQLFIVQNRWYNIGLSLGLRVVILDNIRNANQTNDVCLRDMLNQRINQGGLTWEKIAKALEQVIVGRKGEAQQVRAKYCTLVATQTVLTRVAPDHPTATIPQQSAFDNSARVIHQPPIPSTKAAITTAGPSYPTTPRVATGSSMATIPQHNAPVVSIPSTKLAITTAGPSYPTTLLAGLGAAVLTTTRVATGSSTATIPHHNVPVVSIPSTKPVISTAGPSYPTNPLAGLLFREANNTPPVNTKVSSKITLF